MALFKGDKVKSFSPKTFDKKYCKLTLTPAIHYHWEVDGAAKPDEKEVEKHVGLWFEHKGKALLGFDGSAFGDLQYKSMDVGKTIAINFEGSGKVGGSKLAVQIILASLKSGSGTAHITGSFNKTTYEAGLENSGKLKFVFNPELKSDIEPQYGEIGKWLLSTPAGREAAERLGWVAVKAGAASAALKAMDLPVTLVIEVAKIDYALYKSNSNYADAKNGEVEVKVLSSSMYHGYVEGLAGRPKRSDAVFNYYWQLGQDQRHSKIKELMQKHPGATEEGCAHSVTKEAAKIGDKTKDFHKIAGDVVWKRYYESRGKKDSLDVLQNHWLYIQGTLAESDSRFKAYAPKNS
jgi:hypothetical protein